MTDFHYLSTSQQVIFGSGILHQLTEVVDKYGWERLMLCTISRFQKSGLIDQLKTILGPRLVAIYPSTKPHVPQEQVNIASDIAEKHHIDAIIGLGGGSPIGLAKAVSLTTEERCTGKSALAETLADQPLIPVIAIPTTYSGSEMTPIYGVTQDVDGVTRKVTVTDPKVTPKVTLYDPELTIPLPPQMTASSGINALAHCVEAVYSITKNPISTASALEGIKYIVKALPQAVADGNDINARTNLLLGAYLAATAVSTAKIGLHHGLCHVLGGTAGVPHGIANGIILPHAIYYNADATADELARVALAMGIASEESNIILAKKSAQLVFDLISQIGLPQRLRDVGVSEEEIPQLAQTAMKSKAVQNNPKQITDTAQIESIYRAAW